MKLSEITAGKYTEWTFNPQVAWTCGAVKRVDMDILDDTPACPCGQGCSPRHLDINPPPGCLKYTHEWQRP